MPKGIYERTKEHKLKLSEAHKGRKVSKETKRKLSENSTKFWLGKKMSRESRKKMSEAKKGKPSWNKGLKGVQKCSKETREKMSKAKTGNKYSLGKYHSKETRIKMSETHKGDKAPNWKGGITAENDIIRAGVEYRLWREAVFARDNWICQKTGIKGGKLRCHHIQNFSDNEDLRFAIDNGITLSEKAHKEFHRRYGIKNNNQQQLNEFLSKVEIAKAKEADEK